MTNNTRKRSSMVCGIGINDADYAMCSTIDGKQVKCPFYKVWNSMLRRCYSSRFHKKNPTYAGCTVASEWFLFSKFKLWMDEQDWQGKQLDKDILIQKNKVYSPSTCIFVSSEINNLLINNGACRGKFPLGVYLPKPKGKYVAQCNFNNAPKHLGYFDTPEEAHEAYKSFKYKYIAEIANQQSEPLRTALLNYVIEG